MALQTASLSVAVESDRAVIRVEGRANFATSVSFKQLVQSLAGRGCHSYVLDLTHCQLMDSTFLGVLVGLTQRHSRVADGGPSCFSLFNANEHVHGIFDNMGILPLFGTIDSLETHGSGYAEFVLLREMPDKETLTRNSLEAHRELMEAHPENALRFKSVAEFLEHDLLRITRARKNSKPAKS